MIMALLRGLLNSSSNSFRGLKVKGGAVAAAVLAEWCTHSRLALVGLRLVK